MRARVRAWFQSLCFDDHRTMDKRLGSGVEIGDMGVGHRFGEHEMNGSLDHGEHIHQIFKTAAGHNHPHVNG